MIKNKYEIGDKVLLKGKIERVERDSKLLSPTYGIRLSNGCFIGEYVQLRERRIFSKAPDMSTDEEDLHVIIQELYNAFQESKKNELARLHVLWDINNIFKDYERKYDRCLSCSLQT